MDLFDTLQKLLSNPINILVLLFVVYQLYQKSQPFPGEDEPPEKINNLQEWNDLLSKDMVVVCDFYATWCPPCKSAAPFYKLLSEDKSYANKVEFRKCNVDKARDVAQACGVQSMPTFKVFRKGREVNSLSGWNESKLRTYIEAAIQ